MSSRIVGCILACFVFALSLGGCTAGDRQAEVGGDSGFQLINSANVYEGSLSLEYRMGDPGGETSLDISLVDCALSKDVPSVIPGGYIDVDKNCQTSSAIHLAMQVSFLWDSNTQPFVLR